VVTQVGQLLTRDGYLFLGASETLWQIQEELEAVDLGSCFAYRHRGVPAAAPVRPARIASPPSLPVAVAPAVPPPARPPVREPAPAARIPEPVPLPAASSVQSLLLSAGRSLAGNRIEEASQALGEVLAADPSDPAAHALAGFLHDLMGRTDEAVNAYRAALYLDPALYQVRLLLADCLLRLGNRDRAEHHFREVLSHLASGRERNLPPFEDLPFPDRARAQRRCRQVLGGG
jgi:tetratricopeptide (TPR) repeat protein